MKKILFVCTGNTCRSPMAKGLCEVMLKEMRIEDIKVLSAGIMPPKGAPASPNAIAAMAELGVDISGHIAVPVTREMVEDCDAVLAMTPSHVAALKKLCPGCENKIGLISEEGITDPFGKDLDAYRACRDELKDAVEKHIKGIFGS